MKFIPILFSTPMVQAILEGRKTMTRRIVKEPALTWLGPDMFNPEFVSLPENDLCRYGYPGDVLWVRESFLVRKPTHEFAPFGYKADFKHSWKGPIKWKPSIHMPKAACRIFLEVTEVRVQRLQEITEEDAVSEGVDPRGPVGNMKVCFDMGAARYQFCGLWGEINSHESWKSNPWVWVVSFKRIDKPETWILPF